MSGKKPLAGCLEKYGKLAVAFSGGTDSTLLAEAARRALGEENVLLLLADSVFLPGEDRRQALAYAAAAGLRLLTVKLTPLDDSAVRCNDELRCYYCKKLIFGKLQAVAAEHGFPVLADGSNLDDLKDYRPGMKAADELGVAHPFLDCRLSKTGIRELARSFGLSNSDRPASACLASRIPTGTPLEAAVLRKVELGEQFLLRLGFSAVRVRALGDLAKLELPPEDFPAVVRQREAIAAGLKKAGFAGVALDLEGYRQGSMNRTGRS